MPRTTFLATDANGTVHKRVSQDRTYTHTVVFQRSKEQAIRNAHEGVKQDRKNVQYIAGQAAMTVDAYIADGKSRYPSLSDDGYWANQHAGHVARAAKFRGDVEAEVQARLADALAKIEAADWSVWYNAGWCGRYDLALKLAAKYTVAAILPAVVKG